MMKSYFLFLTLFFTQAFSQKEETEVEEIKAEESKAEEIEAGNMIQNEVQDGEDKNKGPILLNTSQKSSFWSFFKQTLSSLEISYTTGEIEAKTPFYDPVSGKSVGEGNADYENWAFSLQNQQEGFQFSFFPEISNSSIDVLGFSDILSASQMGNIKNKTDIYETVARKFDSYTEVSPTEPNIYKVNVLSFELKSQVGYHHISNCDSYPICSTGEIQFLLSLFDIHRNSVKLGNSQSSKWGMTSFPSWGHQLKWLWSLSFLKGITGKPPLFGFGMEWYYKKPIKFDHDMEYRTSYIYNEKKDFYERRRVYVNELEISLFVFSTYIRIHL